MCVCVCVCVCVGREEWGGKGELKVLGAMKDKRMKQEVGVKGVGEELES